MKYYSTRDKCRKHPVHLKEAVLRGLAPDGGLYLPEKYIPLSPKAIDQVGHIALSETAFAAAQSLTGAALPSAVLRQIVEETINFPLPVVQVEADIFSLELFHGPTMAFKDVGARFMARLMGYFVKDSKVPLKVVVATSGDTGSAVAAGFFQVPGIEVTILYPKGKVSPLQEKQLTTWGGNITAVEIDGTFDDCQRIAKPLLSAPELNRRHQLTSANSINIARLIPQSFYYFAAWGALRKKGKPLVVCVPSGNFGNLTGGLIAKKLGLPIDHFVAATNANDVVPQYAASGSYQPRTSVQTISNAMDVGNPSNFERMHDIFGESLSEFRYQITALAYSDEATRKAMKDVHHRTGYTLDPHGAIGYLGLREILGRPEHRGKCGIFLETAHPAKFIDVVRHALHREIEIPQALQAFAAKEKQALSCPAEVDAVRDILDR